MTMVNVQYSDSKKTKIISVFSCPQDVDKYPNQGQEDTDSDLYKEYVAEIRAASPYCADLLPS